MSDEWYTYPEDEDPDQYGKPKQPENQPVQADRSMMIIGILIGAGLILLLGGLAFFLIRGNVPLNSETEFTDDAVRVPVIASVIVIVFVAMIAIKLLFNQRVQGGFQRYDDTFQRRFSGGHYQARMGVSLAIGLIVLVLGGVFAFTSIGDFGEFDFDGSKWISIATTVITIIGVMLASVLKNRSRGGSQQQMTSQGSRVVILMVVIGLLVLGIAVGLLFIKGM